MKTMETEEGKQLLSSKKNRAWLSFGLWLLATTTSAFRKKLCLLITTIMQGDLRLQAPKAQEDINYAFFLLIFAPFGHEVAYNLNERSCPPFLCTLNMTLGQVVSDE